MLSATKRLWPHAMRALTRPVAAARPISVVSVLAADGFVPTVDHNTSVERAAQLMAERHIDAVPVTKNDRVVGLFTERDYFDKVLNARHQATKSSMVCEVGIMGPELVIARPTDSVEDCLSVMTKKNLTAMPVVAEDGHAVGMVSVLDLTRQYMESQQSRVEALQFSEPTFFPENLVLPDGGVHDEELGDAALFEQLARDPTDALLEHTNHDLEGQAAELFCEGSVFPEYTATEELLLAQAHGDPRLITQLMPDSERDKRLDAAYAELMENMDAFSEASDFPETITVEEAIQARAKQFA